MDGAAGIVEREQVDTAFVVRFLTARVTEAESAAFARQSAEVIAFTLLAIQSRLGDANPLTGPTTPSGVVPPNEKPAAKVKWRTGGRVRSESDGSVERPFRAFPLVRPGCPAVGIDLGLEPGRRRALADEQPVAPGGWPDLSDSDTARRRLRSVLVSRDASALGRFVACATILSPAPPFAG
ncbi:MAG: hypothetical protein ACK5Q5_01760 [Planctomycetaceae bacterium]